MKETVFLTLLMLNLMLRYVSCEIRSSDPYKPLPYTVIHEICSPVDGTGYTKIIRFVFVNPSSGNYKAYAGTAIAAARKGTFFLGHGADSCLVYVFNSPASIVGGGCLARAKYVPEGKNAGGGKEKVWRVLAVTTPMTRQELERVAVFYRHPASAYWERALAAAEELGVSMEEIKAASEKFRVCEGREVIPGTI